MMQHGFVSDGHT